MDFDLDYLHSYENDLGSVESEINRHYSSEWNDDVHESFHDFVTFFHSKLRDITELMYSMSDILGSLNQVDANALSSKLDRTNSRVN